MTRRSQLVVLIAAGLGVLLLVALILFLTTETRSHKVARLHGFAASLPAFAGQPVLPAASSAGTCPQVNDGSDLPALVARHAALDTDGQDAQAGFIASAGSVTWQGTGAYAYGIATAGGHTYELTFPSDDASDALQVTACD